MTVLVASDLDRTLIYSRAAVAEYSCDVPLTAVETRAGVDVSFLTAESARLLSELSARALVVPVTTRTPEQLARVRLPIPAGYAIAANGGCLVRNGVIDADWQAEVTRRVAQVAPLDEIRAQLTAVCRQPWTVRLTQAAGLFCYAVVDRAALPPGFLAEITAWAAERGWTTSLQGRKLYCVPRTLTKSAAVAEVVRRVSADTVLAAGDSLLDIDLLEHADSGVHPGHGELAESGWTAPDVHRTTTAGVLAGEDICRWFLAQVTGTAWPGHLASTAAIAARSAAVTQSL